jgi:hypothetical protein
MSTLTIVATYTGTGPAIEVTSYTSAGSAFASLTLAEYELARSVLRKSLALQGGGAASNTYDKFNGRA